MHSLFAPRPAGLATATRLAAALVAAALVAPSAAAQIVSQVIPPVGSPGDTVRIVGQDLAGLRTVDFYGIVGGFVGQLVLTQPVTVLSPTEVAVAVPTFGAFAPPGATPPGQLAGFIQLPGSGQTVAFGLLEATLGAVTTVGQGTVQPGGVESRIGFSIAGGAPGAGNPSFVVTAYDLPLQGLALVAVGLPLAPPFPPLAGGELLLDPGGPLLVAPGAIRADPFTGQSFLGLPVPPSAAGATVGLQWIGFDPLTLAPDVTNGLRATL